MRRNKHKKKGLGKKVYSIVVDGETEVWYFQMMKKHETTLRINIKPALPKKKKLKELYEIVIEQAKHYDKVIWIVDFDTIAKENKEAKKGKKAKIQEFKEYVKKLKKYHNVEILVNTPCLEFWYLLHFYETATYYPVCEKVIKQLKKNHLLSDYKKSQKYYKKQHNDIYKKLKPQQKTAIANAKRLAGLDFENPVSAKAEIYKVFDLLDI